ncbi:MAG: GNAT family N-acetyltransferase, partial [Dehalococcoidia bacterium]
MIARGFASSPGADAKDMQLRPYRESDIPELVSLLNEAERGSYEFIPYTEEDVRVRLTGASCVLLAEDEQRQMVGLAYLRQDWYGETVSFYVRPGSSREEVADLLLPVIEPENKTGSLSTGIDSLDQDRLAFFTARGYGEEGSLYQMVAQLDHLRPLPQLAEGYLMRSLKPHEEETLIRLANAAYEGERLRPGILDRWKKEDPAFGTDWIQVAEYEGELVALVVARSEREYNEHYHASRGYLGPAGTLPAHRGKDLVKALTARAMNFLHERAMQTVCLQTWHGNLPALAVIKALGFRLDHEW